MHVILTILFLWLLWVFWKWLCREVGVQAGEGCAGCGCLIFIFIIVAPIAAAVIEELFDVEEEAAIGIGFFFAIVITGFLGWATSQESNEENSENANRIDEDEREEFKQFLIEFLEHVRDVKVVVEVAHASWHSYSKEQRAEVIQKIRELETIKEMDKSIDLGIRRLLQVIAGIEATTGKNDNHANNEVMNRLDKIRETLEKVEENIKAYMDDLD